MTRRLAALLLLSAAACQAEPSRRDDDGGGGGGLSQIEGTQARDDSEAKAAPPAPTQPAVPSGQGDANSAPAPGSGQRAAIMDAVRPAIEAQLGAPIEFVVSRVEVEQGWALLIGVPQRPGGGAVDESRLPPEEERDGVTVNAFLRFQDGRWNLVDHAIGPTDLWYCGYEGPPASLTRC